MGGGEGWHRSSETQRSCLFRIKQILDKEIQGYGAARAEIADLRTDLTKQMGELRAELHKEMGLLSWKTAGMLLLQAGLVATLTRLL